MANEAYNNAMSVIREVSKVVTGKEQNILKAFAAVIAGGHILIEDVPGVGKTTLALSLSRAMRLKQNRVQFTPDVMPSDILGFSMYKKEQDRFEYHPGPIACNLFLADEINRTSPKTQSALLEVMEEGAWTVDGVTRKVMDPFIVIATQNPKGSAGTQLLPESQLDRFMICMSMGYPDLKDEIAIAKGRTQGMSVNDIMPVLDASGLVEIKKNVSDVFVHNNVYAYIVKLVQATRENVYVELGVSPRGTIACTRMAMAWAFMQGRDYVVPEDVEKIFRDVAMHRIVMNTKARVAKVSREDVLTEILGSVRQPASFMERK
ncbi:MAG: MoxR family ATPase [Lachnospiraceae bacterium]|nr:MoxR family ATPase [Lachnospiraceae bacterium]MBQ3907148.1 MoxR family ATPase [Lachnospiraceae bacterium]